MLNYTSQPSPGTAQLRTTSQVALLIYACSLQRDPPRRPARLPPTARYI